MKTIFAFLVLGFLVATGCGRTAPEAAPATVAPAPVVAKAPTCAASVSSPVAFEGANLFGSGTLDDCSESDWDGFLEVRVRQGKFFAGIDIDRSQALPGNTLDLGAEAVAFTNNYGPCEGTVTWLSDEPDWSVSVDAVCHGLDGDYNFSGTFHGHVYSGNN